MNMQPEDEIHARDLLHVFDDGGVAFVAVINWSIQCENGCVPAEAILRPSLRRDHRPDWLRS